MLCVVSLVLALISIRTIGNYVEIFEPLPSVGVEWDYFYTILFAGFILMLMRRCSAAYKHNRSNVKQNCDIVSRYTEFNSIHVIPSHGPSW